MAGRGDCQAPFLRELLPLRRSESSLLLSSRVSRNHKVTSQVVDRHLAHFRPLRFLDKTVPDLSLPFSVLFLPLGKHGGGAIIILDVLRSKDRLESVHQTLMSHA